MYCPNCHRISTPFKDELGGEYSKEDIFDPLREGKAPELRRSPLTLPESKMVTDSDSEGAKDSGSKGEAAVELEEEPAEGDGDILQLEGPRLNRGKINRFQMPEPKESKSNNKRTRKDDGTVLQKEGKGSRGPRGPYGPRNAKGRTREVIDVGGEEEPKPRGGGQSGGGAKLAQISLN